MLYPTTFNVGVVVINSVVVGLDPGNPSNPIIRQLPFFQESSGQPADRSPSGHPDTASSPGTVSYTYV
jgi:hypothetical protein